MTAVGCAMGFHRKISGMQKDKLITQENAAKQLDQTIKAIQEIRLSPNVASSEEKLRAGQDQGDKAKTAVANLENYFYITLGGTNIATSALTVLVGRYLGVSPQELMAVMMYSGQIQDPLLSGVESLMKTITGDIHAVNRLHLITGDPKDIVLPNSDIEKQRTPISELKNHKIEIKDLHFLNILKGVSLTVEEGEFVTIVGPSGIGKSTLLKNILGLLKSNGGTVTIGDVETRNIKKYDPQESLYKLVAYADQKPQILTGQTLRENLLLGLEGVSDEKIHQVMLELGLYKEGIKPGVDKSDPTVVNFALDDKVEHDLSGGQKVRVGIARALLRDAKIILLDEPTASLDGESAKDIRQLLVKLHKDKPGTTIVSVTHDENLIEDSKRIGKSYSMDKEVNNLNTVEGLRELILSVQPELPEDAHKFLTQDLYRLTGIDIYDLRRVLVPHAKEAVIYSDMIWQR